MRIISPVLPPLATQFRIVKMLAISRRNETTKPERETISYRLNYGAGRVDRLVINPKPATVETIPFLIPIHSWNSDTANAPAGFTDFVCVDGNAWRVRSGHCLQTGTNPEHCAPIDRHDLKQRVDSRFNEVAAIDIVEPMPIAVILAQRDLSAQHHKLSLFDWQTNPATWKRENVLYYLEHVCDVNLSCEYKTATDAVTAELLTMAVHEFRKRNTETASADFAGSTLTQSLKRLKKLITRKIAYVNPFTISINQGVVDFVALDADARFAFSELSNTATGNVSTSLPLVALLDVCTKTKTRFVTITLNVCELLSEYSLTVKTDNAVFTLKTQAPNDSTEFSSDFPASFAHNLNAAELHSAIENCEFATDTESSRYALGGLCFLANGSDQLDVVGTDSRRLAWQTLPAEVLGTLPEDKQSAVIPCRALNLLSDEIKKRKTSVVSFAVAEVVVSSRQAFKNETCEHGQRIVTIDGVLTMETFRMEFVFELPGVFSLRGTVIDGRFPHHRDVIPRSFASTFDFNRAALLSAVQSAMVATDEESRGVDFKFPFSSSAQLELISQSENCGRSVVHCDAIRINTYDDVDATGMHLQPITFDPKYIAEYLKTGKSETVSIGFNCPETACVMTCEGINGGYLIMPLYQDR